MAPQRRLVTLAARRTGFSRLSVLTFLHSGFVDSNHEVLFSGLRPTDAAEVLTALEEREFRWPLGRSPGLRVHLDPKDLVYRTRIDLAAPGSLAKGPSGLRFSTSPSWA